MNEEFLRQLSAALAQLGVKSEVVVDPYHPKLLLDGCEYECRTYGTAVWYLGIKYKRMPRRPEFKNMTTATTSTLLELPVRRKKRDRALDLQFYVKEAQSLADVPPTTEQQVLPTTRGFYAGDGVYLGANEKGIVLVWHHHDSEDIKAIMDMLATLPRRKDDDAG